MHVILVVIRHWDEIAAIYHRDIGSTVLLRTRGLRTCTDTQPSLYSALITSFLLA